MKQGKGSTNDGNTARRFFQDPEKAAEITGIDESLVKRFGIILQAISCGHKLNTEVFRKYALETAKLFVEKYPWYYMPTSIHKILIHGADVMDSLIMPIGQLSEEALESRHKECRYYREHNTRKMSRRKNMEDLLHILLVTSDPLISSKRTLPRKKPSKLLPAVVSLLEISETSPTNEESDHSECEQSVSDDSDIED